MQPSQAMVMLALPELLPVAVSGSLLAPAVAVLLRWYTLRRRFVKQRINVFLGTVTKKNQETYLTIPPNFSSNLLLVASV